MTEQDAAAKWQALDGFEFAGGTFVLSLHKYPNGRPAVQVYAGPESTCPGEPWCRLTVNLDEHELEPGEFHVRREDLKCAGTVFATLRAEGKIEPTGRKVGAGFSANYAEVWVLL